MKLEISKSGKIKLMANFKKLKVGGEFTVNDKNRFDSVKSTKTRAEVVTGFLFETSQNGKESITVRRIK